MGIGSAKVGPMVSTVRCPTPYAPESLPDLPAVSRAPRRLAAPVGVPAVPGAFLTFRWRPVAPRRSAAPRVSFLLSCCWRNRS